MAKQKLTQGWINKLKPDGDGDAIYWEEGQERSQSTKQRTSAEDVERMHIHRVPPHSRQEPLIILGSTC